MTRIQDEEAIDAVDGFVFGDDQATDVALKLLKGCGRKHGRKKGAIVLYKVRNCNQRYHTSTSRDSNGWVSGGILSLWSPQRRGKSISDRCKSRVTNSQKIMLNRLRNTPGTSGSPEISACRLYDDNILLIRFKDGSMGAYGIGEPGTEILL